VTVIDRSLSHADRTSSSPPSMTPNPAAKPRTEQHDRSSNGAVPQGDPAICHPQPNRRSHHVTNA
jgi:hypothetical protein